MTIVNFHNSDRFFGQVDNLYIPDIKFPSHKFRSCDDNNDMWKGWLFNKHMVFCSLL